MLCRSCRLVSFYLEIGEWFSFPLLVSVGQIKGHSHLQGRGPSVFIEHFAVLHDLTIKECPYGKGRTCFLTQCRALFSLVRVTALWFLPVGMRWEGGKLDHENSTGW